MARENDERYLLDLIAAINAEGSLSGAHGHDEEPSPGCLGEGDVLDDETVQRILWKAGFGMYDGLDRQATASASLGRTATDARVSRRRKRWAETRIAGACNVVRGELSHEAEAEATRSLRDRVGTLAERVQACCAWLLLYRDSTGELESFVSHSARHVKLRVSEDRSIVTYVAQSKRGYVQDNVEDDTHYRPEVSGIKSAMSVPILDAHGRLLAVLHLESREEAAFSRAQLVDLEVSVQELVPYLLVLRRLADGNGDSYVWFPLRYAWNLELVLRRWVHALTESVAGEGMDGPCFTLWYADWEKEKMWVMATTRYHYEFMRRKTLGIESFTGSVAMSPRGTVLHAAPDDPRLVCGDKAARMGVYEIAAAPVYVPGDVTRASGALSVFYFRERPNELRLSDSFLAELAGRAGQMMASYVEQKHEFAMAYMQHKLSRSRSPGETMIKGMLYCLEAEEGSIFSRGQGDEKLVGLVSTGLGEGDFDGGDLAATAVDRRRGGRLVYDMRERRDQGFTVYLGRHPGAGVRKNDVPDPSEKGLPADFPRVPSNKLREVCATSDTDHRRFLGATVNQGADVLGVIRVLRSPESKPFTPWDLDLCQSLARLSAPLLLDHRNRVVKRAGRNREMVRGGTEARPGRTDESVIVRAVNRLTQPVSDLGTPPGRRINELLQDIVTVVRQDLLARGEAVGECELLACFHAVRRTRGLMHLKLYEYHSSTHRELRQRAEPMGVVERDNIAYQALRGRHIFTANQLAMVDLFGSPIDGNGGGVSQAVVPTVSWVNGNLVEGVLSITSQTRIEWDEAYVQFLQRASHRLSAILGLTERSVVPVVAEGRLADAVREFGARSAKLLGGRWSRVCLREEDAEKVAAEFGSAPPGSIKKWQIIDKPTPKDDRSQRILQAAMDSVRDYGVEMSVDRRAYRIPLYIGSAQIGTLQSGPVDLDLFGELPKALGAICTGWSIMLLNNVRGWSMDFRPEAWSPVISRWEQRFRSVLQEPQHAHDLWWPDGRASLN